MPTLLTPARHRDGLRDAVAALGVYAGRAGDDAPVPTCPGWAVRDLVAHVADVHRQAAPLLESEAAAYWTRRMCHETTVHAVDALAACLGRPAVAREVWFDAELAADGVDEVLHGPVRGPRSGLRCAEESVLVVRPDDVADWWRVEVGPHPARAQRRCGADAGDAGEADWELTGPVVELYLRLWDRAAPMSPRPLVGLTSRTTHHRQERT